MFNENTTAWLLSRIFDILLSYMFSLIENTFYLKFLSYFEHNYNGTTRPETPMYFHQILHSNFAVFEYDMYIVCCLGVFGNISCKGYLKLL